MSGFEIVGVISGSATLAGVSLKIIHHLRAFVARAKDAHNVAKDLQEKIEQIHACSQTVEVTSSRRGKHFRVERPGRAERDLWEGIKRSLGQCQRVLTKFEGALRGLKCGKAELSWLEKGLLQLKLDNSDPEIRRLENKIDTHLQTLQISILCVQILAATAHHDEIKTILAGHTTTLERLDELLQSGRIHVKEARRDTTFLLQHGRGEASRSSFFDVDDFSSMSEDACQSDDPEKELNAIKNMEKVLEVATDVRAISIYDAESVRGTLSDATDRHSLMSGTTGYGSTISFDRRQDLLYPSRDDSLPDPTPDFDDTMPREVLEALIERFKTQVRLECLAGHYHQAEQNQQEAIRHLEELQSGYDVPFEDFHPMQSMLAQIYLEQDKVEEAEKILHDKNTGKLKPRVTAVARAATMPESDTRQASALDYYLLAQVNHRKHLRENSKQDTRYLEDAEKYAKRAFKRGVEAGDTSDPTFVKSVKLLIQIYDDRNKMLHAKTFRELYLQQPEDLRPPPSPLSSTRSLSITQQITPTISSNASLNTVIHKDNNGTPSDLISAITDGRDDLIDDMLQQQAAEIETSRNGKTAVMHAVDRNNEKAIRKLHSAGAQLNQALFYAVRCGNADMTKLLLSLDADKEARNQSGSTPLLVAARGKHPSVVEELLNEGVDVDARDRAGWTAVHYAALSGNVNVMRTLLEPRHRAKMVNKDAVCPAGKTALHYLAESGKIPVAEVLLEHGANAELKDDTASGRTPLYLAVERRKYEFVRMLIERGVTVQYETLPKTSQEIRNLLAQAERAIPAPERRDSSGTTTSRQSSLSKLSSLPLRGFGRLRKR
ncbi:hypothetical protein H2201_004923 [Coniosporium apollinis]|uniref:Fungal N-terminal domain-containing protein n=1 Tax=Coniosporium apollinis TaxID=61459 RepID=A0ABQ9NRL3_9PEZI|nr:hypothetical protein H2201_004923 [Coniosporium apollinis]